MRIAFQVTRVWAFTWFGFAAQAGPNDIVIDLGRGPVTVHVPDAYDGSVRAPLVLLLHGYGSSGFETELVLNLQSLVDPLGFCYAYPDGTQDVLGNRFWNATDACCNFFSSNVDDSGYLRAFIEAAKTQLSIDDRRVYVVGHSNGAFMAYRMACEHADAVAAIVSYAGATWDDRTQCTPSEPVHVLQIHGTADGTIFYDGGELLGVDYPGALESVLTWVGYDGCSGVVDTSSPPLDIDASVPGAETTVFRYVDGCAPGGSAELWRVQGGGHVPVPSADFGTLAIEWLYAHAEPGIDPVRYCSPNNPNSTGVPGVLHAAGSDVLVENDVTLRAEDLPANQFGYFLASLQEGFVANAGGSAGNLCLGGSIARYAKDVQNSGTLGAFELAIDLEQIPFTPPVAVQSGETWRFQAWHRDGVTSNFTDGLALTFR